MKTIATFFTILENSLLYNFLEASRFSSYVHIQVSIQAQAFRNSKLDNVHSFACFTSFELELFSVDNYKWWAM